MRVRFVACRALRLRRCTWRRFCFCTVSCVIMALVCLGPLFECVCTYICILFTAWARLPPSLPLAFRLDVHERVLSSGLVIQQLVFTENTKLTSLMRLTKT